MTAGQWVTYCLAIFTGGLIPGPITLIAMTTGAKRGIVSAIPAAMGNVMASVVQLLVSLAFIGVIAQSLDAVFRIMMAAGGVYLICLGIGLYRSNPFKFTEDTAGYESSARRKDFASVFLITLLNPKSILFFVALFPLVVPKDNHSVLLICTMTAVFALIVLLCFLVYAMFGKAIRWLAGKAGFADALNFILSAVFVIIGGWAVFSAF